MSSENTPGSNPPSPGGLSRRASYAPGQKLTEMFGRTPTANGGSSAYSGSIAAAAANASAHQRRRMSVSSIGLSGTSPTQTSPFMPNRARQGSQSSSGSAGGTDDSAIDESGDSAGPPAGSQFTRRLSFGARAMRDARAGSGGIFGNGRTPKSHSASRSVSSSVFSPSAVSGASATTSTPSSGRGEGGFSFSDQMRSRAERSSMSVTGSPIVNSPTAGTFRGPAAKPATSAPTHSAPEPPKEMPKSPRAPDHFQERILKGDFYMD